MAFDLPGLMDGTEVAAADLSAKQYYAVKYVSGGVNLAGVGEPIAGILQDNPTSGQSAQVQVSGASKAVAGAAFSKGASLEVDAAGKLITASGVAGRHLVAFAKQAAGADGDVISVLLKDLGEQS